MGLAISDKNSCIDSLVAHRCNTNRDLMLSLWATCAKVSASNLKLNHARKTILVPIIKPSFQTNRSAATSEKHKSSGNELNAQESIPSGAMGVPNMAQKSLNASLLNHTSRGVRSVSQLPCAPAYQASRQGYTSVYAVKHCELPELNVNARIISAGARLCN